MTKYTKLVEASPLQALQPVHDERHRCRRLGFWIWAVAGFSVLVIALSGCIRIAPFVLQQCLSSTTSFDQSNVSMQKSQHLLGVGKADITGYLGSSTPYAFPFANVCSVRWWKSI